MDIHSTPLLEQLALLIVKEMPLLRELPSLSIFYSCTCTLYMYMYNVHVQYNGNKT